jgi:site-specific DNA-cytosine methylase
LEGARTAGQRRWRVFVAFCGVGVGSYGFTRAPNAEVAGAADVSEVAAASFRVNHPDAAVSVVDHFNVSALAAVMEECGPLNLVESSPPCQHFSWAGDRDAGHAERRLSFLWALAVLRLSHRP